MGTYTVKTKKRFKIGIYKKKTNIFYFNILIQLYVTWWFVKILPSQKKIKLT